MSAGPSNFTGAPDGPGEENSTRICSKCRGRKALHHFVSCTGKRSVQRCASCRESDAALRAKKKLAEGSPSSSLRSNIVVGQIEQPSSATPAIAATPASSSSIRSNIIVAPFQSHSTNPTTPSPLPRIAPASRREHREPQFFRRGNNSQDTPEAARRRAEDVVRQRRHRAARRHGELPSLTPDLPLTVRQEDDGGDDGGDDLSDDVDGIGMISESRYGYADSICRFSVNTTAAAPVNHRCIIDIEPSLWEFHRATTCHETPGHPRT